MTYQPTTFSGLTISYNTKAKKEVEPILEKVEKLDATFINPSQKVYWDGYSSYIKELNGHLFEVAHNPF